MSPLSLGTVCLSLVFCANLLACDPANLVALAKAQKEVQAHSFKDRSLSSYGFELHLNGYGPIVDWLSNEAKASGVSINWSNPLLALLEIQKARKGQSPLYWVDVPSGYGVALKEGVGSVRGLDVVGVDVVDWVKEGKASPNRAGKFIQADMTDVKFPNPPDVLTSVQGLQYVDNKLATLVNFYNQLADGGVAVIAADNLGRSTQAKGGNPPIADFVETLRKSGIVVITSPAGAHDFRSLLIVKKPKTSLDLKAKYVRHDSGVSHYEVGADGVVGVSSPR